MVTDEERDYMYRAYAHDSEMRINLGIRRRLAPLVGNDRRKMELLNGLLFSLPGTPVLYYGDEIGMGDNVYLGDRNGVRTPMQWSADRNAGFSRANPQRLILPIIIDPEYHYEAINVEAQQNNPNSLLWWTKRLIALRKQFQAFGRGTMEFLTPQNYRVLAFVREHGDETILVVANLSRFPQYVELDLAACKGMRPLELFGHSEFPAIGELPYLLTLPGYAFYWFSIEPPPAAAGEEEAAGYVPPTLACRDVDSLLAGERTHRAGGRAVARSWRRAAGSAGAASASPARASKTPWRWAAYTCWWRASNTRNREAERYVLPLAVVPATQTVAPHALAALLHMPGGDAQLVDAMEDGEAARAVLNALAAHAHASGTSGSIEAKPFTELLPPDAEPRNISAQHAAAAVRYGDKYLLKMFRRLEEGTSPGAGADPLPERARPRAGAHHRRRDRIPAPPRGTEHARGAAGVRRQRGDGVGARARGAAPFLRARAHPASRRRRARHGAARAARAGRDRAARRRARRHRRVPRSRGAARQAHGGDAPSRWRRTSTTPASRPSRTARSTGGPSTSRCATWSARRCACCATTSPGCPPRWSTRGAGWSAARTRC